LQFSCEIWQLLTGQNRFRLRAACHDGFWQIRFLCAIQQGLPISGSGELAHKSSDVAEFVDNSGVRRPAA
jgi:hypothetical protein